MGNREGFRKHYHGAQNSGRALDKGFKNKMRATGQEIYDYIDKWPLGSEWKLDTNEAAVAIFDNDGYEIIDRSTYYDTRDLGEIVYIGSRPLSPAIKPLDLGNQILLWLKRNRLSRKSEEGSATFTVEIPLDGITFFLNKANDFGWNPERTK
jgi:hypothetical protein